MNFDQIILTLADDMNDSIKRLTADKTPSERMLMVPIIIGALGGYVGSIGMAAGLSAKETIDLMLMGVHEVSKAFNAPKGNKN